eukprot:scaffold282895_cov28-Tisochrysis_lutea.AAC.5
MNSTGRLMHAHEPLALPSYLERGACRAHLVVNFGRQKDLGSPVANAPAGKATSRNQPHRPLFCYLGRPSITLCGRIGCQVQENIEVSTEDVVIHSDGVSGTCDAHGL